MRTLLLFLLFPLTLTAQSPEELFAIALSQNPTLKALELEYRAALEKAPQVGQLPNPEIGIGGFILPVETRLGAQRAKVSALQRFPWFGTLKAREDWIQTAAQANFEQIAMQQLDIFYHLKLAYLQLYEIIQSQAVLKQNMALLLSLKTLAETNVSTGKATLADILRVDLQIQLLTQQLKVLETQSGSRLRI